MLGLSVPEEFAGERNRLTGGHVSDDSSQTDDRAGGDIAPQAGVSWGRVPSALSRRRWVSTGGGLLLYFLQPLLWLSIAALALFLLGESQRRGWLPRVGTVVGGVGGDSATVAGGGWICPMMCTGALQRAGRCPVCAMELVPATSGHGVSADAGAVRIEGAARRVANIQTVPVRLSSGGRVVQAVGRLDYDEGTRRTLSARVDGRIEKLFADYTGVVVRSGDCLAVVYSPDLYSAQVEYLLSRGQREGGIAGTAAVGGGVGRGSLLESSRRRLLELGMAEQQVVELESGGEASSRLQLVAPISGTVVEKLAVEGQYVREGEAVFQLADLSAVWLILELFPEEAAGVRFGQRVHVEVQSLPGRRIEGRVVFVAPRVTPETRTVGVRVVLPNEEGELRVGDYARAEIEPVVMGSGGLVYDPELASAWISLRHPHMTAAGPGTCPICGEALISGRELGFTDESAEVSGFAVIPRDALLLAGDSSVVYVEVEPGRFELRQVVAGRVSGGEVEIVEGLSVGEQVAVRGNFLIDSQMQLSGKPSLIDPQRHVPGLTPEQAAKTEISLGQLSPADRELAERQRVCPIAGMLLGSMGVPIRVEAGGESVFLCCEGCRGRLLSEPEKYLRKLSPGVSGAGAAAGAVESFEASAGVRR